MKIFVDTGSIKDIEALANLGVIDGVTTNPSLMAKEKGDGHQIIREICRIVQGPVSAEVVATDTEGMLREGPRAGLDRSARRGEGAVHERRREGVPHAGGRGHEGERHAHLLGHAGAAGRQGRRLVREPVHRPAR